VQETVDQLWEADLVHVTEAGIYTLVDVLESAPRDLLDNNSDKHIPAKVEKAGVWLEWLPGRQPPHGTQRPMALRWLLRP
jgi:hypothetical protein